MVNQDADLAEFLITRSKRDVVMHPRSPVIFSNPKVAKDIDLSGIFRMTPEQIDEALRAIQEAA